MKEIPLWERIQTCLVCGRKNKASQSGWRACCLMNFDFTGIEFKRYPENSPMVGYGVKQIVERNSKSV